MANFLGHSGPRKSMEFRPLTPKPYQPEVTLEQILAYDASKPETFTQSAFMNAVLEAYSHPEYLGGSCSVADYLGLDSQKLTHVLQVICGMSQQDLRLTIVLHRYETILEEDPKLSPDIIARQLGFYDRSTLWRLLERVDKAKSQNGYVLKQRKKGL